MVKRSDTEILRNKLEIDREIVSLRRYFHQHPELSNQEEETSRKVAEVLKSIGLEVLENIGGYGVVGLLEGGRPGKTAAVRADMDALPLDENNDVEYRSLNPGIMHACGHDSHMAVVLGAAMLMSLKKESINGSVKFVFQPSEEKPPGGAKGMIEAGVLENPSVDGIFGLHNSTNIPAGEIIVLDGPVMAGSDLFTVKIMGHGGHGAMPEKTSDTILIASHFVITLQNIINRKFRQFDHPVVSFGKIEGGSAHNIIPREVFLTGTVRHFNSESEPVAREIESILDSLVGIFGGEYEFKYTSGYPRTYNDADFAELVRLAASGVEGVTRVRDSLERAYFAEDFGYYCQKVPACYFFFGAQNVEKGMDTLPHTAEFDLDDSILPVISQIVMNSVINFLQR